MSPGKRYSNFAKRSIRIGATSEGLLSFSGVSRASNVGRENYVTFIFTFQDVDNEKIDNQEWVVCDKNDKDLSFEDDDDDLGSGVVIDDDKVFDEMPERSEVENYVKTDEVEEEDVICEDDDDDDWQGIKMTKFKKRFGVAVAFMGSKSSCGAVVKHQDVKFLSAVEREVGSTGGEEWIRWLAGRRRYGGERVEWKMKKRLS
ncbi:hypothetical protein Tco_0751193 [Tanacetum coccineum]|uniref:Uncharacterized protein n=1 Tax=Tanacetum coccineum TaxID=301880 RepID=A0ABQ4Z661_9ASTR